MLACCQHIAAAQSRVLVATTLHLHPITQYKLSIQICTQNQQCKSEPNTSQDIKLEHNRIMARRELVVVISDDGLIMRIK